MAAGLLTGNVYMISNNCYCARHSLKPSDINLIGEKPSKECHIK